MTEPITVGHTNSFYHPNKNDIVIGIIDKRNGEDWLVDIGFSHQALLPMLAFSGATKKNCPKFQRGEVVVAFVEEVPDSGEIILSCIERKKNEKLGRLTGGTLVRARPKDIERIKDLNLIDKIATKSAITCSFAQNGRLYIDLSNDILTVLVSNLITNCLSSPEPEQYFDKGLETIDWDSKPII